MRYYISDTELYHWKYIKKERRNGKWVYYYDESELKTKETNMNRAKESYDKVQSQFNSAANEQARYNQTFMNKPYIEANTNTAFALSKPLSRLAPKVVEAGKKYETAKKDYMKSYVSSIAERTSQKASLPLPISSQNYSVKEHILY